MSAALNHLGSELFGLLGQLSVELAALAVIVLLVGRVLRIKSPALRHFLWVAVLLKPIIAVTVTLALDPVRPVDLVPGIRLAYRSTGTECRGRTHHGGFSPDHRQGHFAAHVCRLGGPVVDIGGRSADGADLDRFRPRRVAVRAYAAAGGRTGVR